MCGSASWASVSEIGKAVNVSLDSIIILHWGLEQGF